MGIRRDSQRYAVSSKEQHRDKAGWIRCYLLELYLSSERALVRFIMATTLACWLPRNERGVVLS